MKKTIANIIRIRVAAATILGLGAVFMAQGHDKVQVVAPELAGSMMPYDFSLTQPVPATGDTLTPVFVSYTARHGSRYISGEKKIELTVKTLAMAKQDGMLTERGEKLYRFVEDFKRKTEGKWGLLSPTGIAEEERLGAEMGAAYGKLFRKGYTDNKSTYYPRVIMTMYQFLHALEMQNKGLDMATLSGHCNDSLLHFFSYNKEYDRYRENGDWKPIYEDFVNRHVSAETMRQYFKPGYITDRQQLRKLAMDLYGLLQAQTPSGFGPLTDEWMSAEALQECYLAANFSHYLRNSINPVSNLAGVASAPLLEQIIRDIDSAESCGDVKMKGYFGHAETLMPLLSLMAIPGCITMSEDFETLYRRWDANRIVPLAANLSITLYRSTTGRLYANVRLNGRNVYPLPTNVATPSPFIPWGQLRAFWQSRIGEYNPK